MSSQRSWSRSIPEDRRNRSTSDVNDPITPMGITRISACAASRNGPSASIPSGFSAFGAIESTNGPGSSRIAR